ncbi:MAG: hypothetical protein FJY29_06995 [Betaproteobacteria bacterium]|nr:hypothetical protein [Betaproteobacteria bacterium]
MFTEGSRQFGVWRGGHPSLNRHAGRPTQALLLAYGLCAFLTWMIFILTLKIRGEFFLIESMNLPLHAVSGESAKPMPMRSVGLSLAIRSTAVQGQSRVVLDTGESFLIPEDKKALREFLNQRVESMELSAMIRKKIMPGLGTVVLWVDKGVTLESMQPLAKDLVSLGFDTLNYAVDIHKPAATERR